MKKDTQKKSSISKNTVAAIGAGMAALAAASYYFFGPQGKKNRTQLRGWMIKMKGDIVEKLEESKDITEPLYHQIIDTVAARYQKTNKESAAEILAFAQMLKGQWKGIVQLFVPKKKAAPRTPAKKKTRAPQKKATKKTPKKK
ncbi:MAG TPA: hypothetical protein VG621_01865 [Candidatus Paceibacterota bacterium]|nr:hypothetical protein [Candidatus Paceibacterota bacterium]